MTPHTLSAADLDRLEQLFPARQVAVGGGNVVSVRELGDAQKPTLVCLHGIGSGSASWLEAAALLSARYRVVAWDAPGYGESTPLPAAAPSPRDYAERVLALLDALQVQRCVLVGHSLGAIMAAAAYRLDSAGRFAAMVLISPAQGYGAAGREEQRAKVRAQRMASLNDTGIAGMAATRSVRLVSAHASDRAKAWVHWNMARLHADGYRQAIELLCGGDLVSDLPAGQGKVFVACGALDDVTPPAACEQVAARVRTSLHLFPNAGHACYVEHPDTVAHWLAETLDTTRFEWNTTPKEPV